MKNTLRQVIFEFLWASQKLRRKILTLQSAHRLGKIRIFHNVVVVPFEHLLEKPKGLPDHQGGPIWPRWSLQLDSRHCRGGYPKDKRPSKPAKINFEVDKLAVWCGPLCHHFGHQIADFSSRILQSASTYPEAKMVFSLHRQQGWTSIQEGPSFVREILSWLGVSEDRVELVTCPTLFKKLAVAPQAEQIHGPGPSGKYIDLLDKLVENNIGKPAQAGTLFVSRAGLVTCCRLAGEGYLERLLESGGIRAIRPETMPLKAQMLEYMSAEKLIFSEGSALHGLQLLGRGIGHVTVLSRRHNFHLASASLRSRVRHLEYLNASEGILFGFNHLGKSMHYRGISLFDEKAIVSYLYQLDTSIGERWNRELYVEYRDRDIMAWIEFNSQLQNSPITAESLIPQLVQNNLTHLIGFAESRLLTSEPLSR